MIHKEELELIHKALNTEEELTLKEQLVIIRLTRTMVNNVRYRHDISTDIHNACAGVYHVMDWPWNEVAKTIT